MVLCRNERSFLGTQCGNLQGSHFKGLNRVHALYSYPLHAIVLNGLSTTFTYSKYSCQLVHRMFKKLIYSRCVLVTTTNCIFRRMGPICQSYLRVPVIRYFKIETCCPGWAADASGKCTISKL